MIVAIWGPDGIGKSTIATELGHLRAKKGIVSVVDTDLTKPTLPVKLPGKEFLDRRTLGHIFSTQFVRDAKMYLHQHPKAETLFFAGLEKSDHYLSYDAVNMSYLPQAKDFVQACSEICDTTILDLSFQKTDPFFAAALELSDLFIIALPPDMSGVCFFESMKPFLTKFYTKVSEKTIYIGTPFKKHHSLSTFEQTSGMKFSAVFPEVRSISEIQGRGDLVIGSPGFGVKRWTRQIRFLSSEIDKILNLAEEQEQESTNRKKDAARLRAAESGGET